MMSLFSVFCSDSHLLSDADYTLCLDALAGGSEMFLHVSKPPKVDTKAYELIQHLNKVSCHSNTAQHPSLLPSLFLVCYSSHRSCYIILQ